MFNQIEVNQDAATNHLKPCLVQVSEKTVIDANHVRRVKDKRDGRGDGWTQITMDYKSNCGVNHDDYYVLSKLPFAEVVARLQAALERSS